MFHGVVKDETGRPVAGATITVVSGTGSYRDRAAVSGPDGRYELNNKADPGSYELRASHSTFGVCTAGAEVSGDVSSEVNFTLRK